MISFSTQHFINEAPGLPSSLSLWEKVQSSSLGHSSRLASMKEKGSIFSSFSFPQSNQILTILSSLPAKVTPRGCRRIAMKWRRISACSLFQPHTYEQHDVFPHRLIAGQCLTLISYQWVAWDFDIADVQRPQWHSEASGYSAHLLPISLHLSCAFILWPLCDVLRSDRCRGRVNGDSSYTSSANVLQPPQLFWSSNEPLLILFFTPTLSLHTFYAFSCFMFTQFLSPLLIHFSLTLILIGLNVSSLHRENEWIKQTFRLMREMEWGKTSAFTGLNNKDDQHFGELGKTINGMQDTHKTQCK